MVKVSIEVDSDADRFTLIIEAESISKALNTAEERYPNGRIRVIFPINPEQFFASDGGAARMVELRAAEVTE